jgi:branched-chain amino acid transport system permease protein
MELFIVTLIAGFCTGVLYGLVGLSFMAVYNASKVINFAQGALAMMGGFVGYLLVFNEKIPLTIGMVLVIVVPIICAIGINYFLAEPLVKRKVPIITIMLATLGASLVLEGGAGWYTHFGWFKTSFVFGRKPIVWGLVRISPQYLVVLIATAILCLGYWLLLNKTNMGLGIRATGNDPHMASLVGIKLRRTRMLAWCISAGITGIAGFMIAPLTLSSALMGFPIVVNGFIAAIIGGFGKPMAAVLGGVVLGLLVQFFTGYISAGFGELLVFIALIFVLAFKPQGIMGSLE